MEPHRAGPASENIHCEAPAITFDTVRKMLDNNTTNIHSQFLLFLFKALWYICSTVATNIVML